MDGYRSEETKALMNELLAEDQWKANYYPETVDFVKWHDDFRRNSLNREKKRFLLCWLDTGLFSYSVCLVFCIYLALFSGVLHSRVSGRGALFTLAGLTYPCVLFAILMDISLSPIWWQTLAMGCVSSWLCDTAALVGGSRFGRHKLAPLVSPHKTVEGALFGAASSVLSALLCWLLYRALFPIPFWLCLLTAFLCSSMGQIGDLAESLLKRMIGVKDFSNLIPGHGGLFDRADALLFSIPTAYFCFLLAGIGA